jgi:hypothetical protein
MPDVRPPSRGIVPAQRLVLIRSTSPAATPATRSTEERASARASFRHPRPSRRYSPPALPLLVPPLPLSTLSHSRVSHTSHSRASGSLPSSRGLSVLPLGPGGVSTIASVVPAFPHLPSPLGPVSVQRPSPPRAFAAIRHSALGQFSSPIHTRRGGLTPACSGLAALATDARR